MNQGIPEIKVDNPSFDDSASDTITMQADVNQLSLPVYSFPKSKSFDSFRSSNTVLHQPTSTTVLHQIDELSNLRSQLMEAENEIFRLRRKNSQLKFDAQDTQKFMFNEQIGYWIAHLEQFKKQYDVAYKGLGNKLESSLRMIGQKDEDIKILTEEINQLKQRNEQQLNEITEKNAILVKKSDDIKNRFTSMTNEVSLLENHLEAHLSEPVFKVRVETSSYESFKKSIFNQDDLNNNQSCLMNKLEDLCQLAFSQQQTIKKLEADKVAILDKYEGYSTDLAKAKVEKKKLETLLNKNAEHIEWCDTALENMGNKVNYYENIYSNKNLNALKSIFCEFNECLRSLKEMARNVIQKDNRSPLNSALMKKDDFFTELGQTSSALKLLDVEFLNNTLREMAEIKRDMIILKADIAIHPSPIE